MKCIKKCGRQALPNRTRCEPCLEKQRVHGRRYRLGFDVENERAIALKACQGMCELCGERKATETDHVDGYEDVHEYDKHYIVSRYIEPRFRAMLCRRCNMVLGLIEEDRSLLQKINEFLEHDA